MWIALGVEDYPFGLLTMIVSLEAIFLSTFVMISQNRADEKRHVIADQQWQTVQQEEQQNERLLRLSNEILDLDQGDPRCGALSHADEWARAHDQHKTGGGPTDVDRRTQEGPPHVSSRMSRPSNRTSTRYGWSPAEPPRRPVLFVNERSGDGAARRAGVVERARDRGIKVVVLDPGQSLPTLVDQAVAGGADALGMAGGDGSLAVVAAAAAAHGLPFICIPAGTRNHFALDLGVDRHDVAGALDAFTRWARAPDRPGRSERPRVSEQRLSRHLR